MCGGSWHQVWVCRTHSWSQACHFQFCLCCLLQQVSAAGPVEALHTWQCIQEQSALFCLWFAIVALLLTMIVQSVEGKDTCRMCGSKWAMEASSYYIMLLHVCCESRIGTGIGKPMVGLLWPSALVGIIGKLKIFRMFLANACHDEWLSPQYCAVNFYNISFTMCRCGHCSVSDTHPHQSTCDPNFTFYPFNFQHCWLVALALHSLHS